MTSLMLAQGSQVCSLGDPRHRHAQSADSLPRPKMDSGTPDLSTGARARGDSAEVL